MIRSRTNPLIKRVRGVRAGKEAGTILLEGERLVVDAIKAGLSLEVALVDEGRVGLGDRLHREGISCRGVEAEVLASASALDTSPGVLALAPLPRTGRLEEVSVSEDTLLLVVAGVSDPGNLGALARAAEGAGVAAICVIEGGARPFGEKALRGSMGSLLRLPVIPASDASELGNRLRDMGVRQVAAATRGGAPWRSFDWSGAVALWVSGETGELPQIDPAPEPVTIPMAGAVESLNVTVAASLLLFAAGRAEGSG